MFGGLRVILELCYDLLVAVGRAGALAGIQIGWLAGLVVALPLGAHLGGIAGVAIAQGLVAVGLVLPLNIRLIVKSGLRLGVILRSLQPVAVAAFGGAAVALLVLRVSVPRGVTLGGGALLVILAYGTIFLASRRGRAALRWADPPYIPSRVPVPRFRKRAAAAQA